MPDGPDAHTSDIMGLDATWFAPGQGRFVAPTRPADRVATCRVVEPSPFLGAEEAALIHRARAAMAAATLTRVFKDLLTEPRPLWRSPLREEDVPLLGGLPHKNAQFFLFFGGASPCTVILARNAGSSIYYHREHLLLCGSAGGATIARRDLTGLLNLLLADRDVVRRYAEAGQRGALRRALVLGDTRPSHYLSQGLNAVERDVLPRLDAFAALGGSLLILADGCFVDPRAVCPPLAGLPSAEVRRADATRLALERNLLCGRLIRQGSEEDFTTIRRFLDGRADGGPGREEFLTGWVSLDVEKMRFRNQVPELSLALHHLAGRAAARGRRLRILWDGWTVTEGTRTDRDALIIGRAEAVVAELRATMRVTFEEAALFDLDLLRKLSLARGADMALCSYGTASMIANLLAGVPTVAYGAPRFVEGGAYVDRGRSVVLTGPDVRVEGDERLKPDAQSFSTRAGAVVDAVRALLEQGRTR